MPDHDIELPVPVLLRTSDAAFPVRAGDTTPTAFIGSDRFGMVLADSGSREGQLAVVPADEVVPVLHIPHVRNPSGVVPVLPGLADLPVLRLDVGFDASSLKFIECIKTVIAAVSTVDVILP